MDLMERVDALEEQLETAIARRDLAKTKANAAEAGLKKLLADLASK